MTTEETIDSFEKGGLAGVIKIGGRKLYFASELSGTKQGAVDALPALFGDMGRSLKIVFRRIRLNKANQRII